MREFLGSALISAADARARFARHWIANPQIIRLATPAALGRVLAVAIDAPEDLPPFRRALMDGYACRAADLHGAPVTLRVVGEVLMGARAVHTLAAGDAVQVPTGGMLPLGADVVVPVEETRREGASLEVRVELSTGRHLIERGEDVRAGERLLEAGHALRSVDVGALMGLGVLEVEVYRPPVVGILSTGDEIVPAEQTPVDGQVRDLNSHALAAAASVHGAVPRRYGLIEDSREALLAAGKQAVAECDVVVFNGGTSVGPRDLVAGVIDELGRPGVLVHGVDIRPGKPTVFALCDGRPVFGLPGQPVSALNTFELFVVPVLRALMGLPEGGETLIARLKAPLRSADGREDHIRVRLQRSGDEWVAQPIAGVSAMITSMVRAEGIVVVPAESPGYEAGDAVTVRRIQ